MPRAILALALLVTTSLVCGVAAQPAMNLQVVEAPYAVAGIDDGARPGDFTVRLQRDMPTAGWTIAVEGLKIEGNRIRVALHERAPGGPAATVITPTSVEVGLSGIAADQHLLEVHVRRDGPSRLEQALVLRGAAGADGGATELSVEDARPFRVADGHGIEIMESMPPQFAINLVRDMPTPGWTLRVAGKKGDVGSGHVSVLIEETGPDGMVAQVLTPTRVRIMFGRLDAGRFVVALHTGSPDAGFDLAGAMVLDAGR